MDPEAVGTVGAAPTSMKTRPTKIETIAVQVPPPDTRSTRKNQLMKATGSTSNGNWKRARRMKPAVMMTRSSSSRPIRNPSNGPSPVSSRMPMRSSNAPAEIEKAISETNANSPAVTRCPVNSKPMATAAMTAHTSSDQPKKPPSECSPARYESNATIATSTTKAPAYMRNEELVQRGRTTSMGGIFVAPSDGGALRLPLESSPWLAHDRHRKTCGSHGAGKRPTTSSSPSRSPTAGRRKRVGGIEFARTAWVG